MFGDLLKVDVRPERHGARVDLEYLKPGLGVRDADLDFAIEASRASERRIQDLRDVRGADDNDLAARHEAVHQAQELRHDALLDLAGHFGALGRHGVDLVDEEDRRRAARRFLEDLAELGFALAIELPHDLRAVEVDEMNSAFSRNSPGEQGFSGAGRAVQQDALRREDSQPFEDARMFERQLHDFAHPRHLALQPADVLVGYGRSAGRGLLALNDPDVRASSDDDRPGGNRAHDLEVHRLGERRHAHRAARDDRHAFQIREHAFGRDDRRRGARPQRREANGHGLGGLDRRHRHLLLQPRAAVAARRAVDLDHALVSIVRELGARDGDRAAGDLQDVAGPGADAHQVGRREPRDGVADVFDARFRYAERHGGRNRGRESGPDAR